jgi:hypothetical protein
MSGASPAGAAVRSAIPETPDIAATAPAPTLRKSLRLVFISAPLIALVDWKRGQAELVFSSKLERNISFRSCKATQFSFSVRQMMPQIHLTPQVLFN